MSVCNNWNQIPAGSLGVNRAWSIWVERISWRPQDPSTVTSGTSTHQYDSDSEYDSREYEMDNGILEEGNNIETFTSTF